MHGSLQRVSDSEGAAGMLALRDVGQSPHLQLGRWPERIIVDPLKFDDYLTSLSRSPTATLTFAILPASGDGGCGILFPRRWRGRMMSRTGAAGRNRSRNHTAALHPGNNKAQRDFTPSSKSVNA